MPYLTPDSIPSDMICRTVVIPNSVDWILIVNGALSELFKAYNFEQYGSLTPDETAAVFLDMWSEYHDSDCMNNPLIGEIKWLAHNNIPSKWLLCQGQELVRTDYPDLYAAIGLNFSPGGTTTTFFLPDLRDRFMYGWQGGTHAPGITGGEVLHTLSIAEMPSHTHEAQRANGVVGGSTARFSIATNPQANPNAFTQPTGGGTPHNNMPPYLTLIPIIYSGVA